MLSKQALVIVRYVFIFYYFSSQAECEESEEKKSKRARHLELTAQLTRDLLPILMEVRYYVIPRSAHLFFLPRAISVEVCVFL